MIGKLGRTTEADLSEVVLKILSERADGIASYRELIELIPARINLTSIDMKPSPTRPTERLWEQRLRNIKSHAKASGNYINEGYLESVKAGLKITAAGKLRTKLPNR